jgi:hypothetical protein
MVDTYGKADYSVIQELRKKYIVNSTRIPGAKEFSVLYKVSMTTSIPYYMIPLLVVLCSRGRLPKSSVGFS